MFSPSRITLENNGKIRPEPDRENAFARTSGGRDGIRILEVSPPKKLPEDVKLRGRQVEGSLSKEPKKNRQAIDFIGAGRGTRTPDPLITNQTLYQLS